MKKIKRILFVEPNRANDRIVKAVLKNFSFASVISVQKAKDMLSKGLAFDLLVILSTVNQPEDGHEFAKQVYARNPKQKLLVLCTTPLDDQKKGIFYFDFGKWNEGTLQLMVDNIFPP